MADVFSKKAARDFDETTATAFQRWQSNQQTIETQKLNHTMTLENAQIEAHQKRLRLMQASQKPKGMFFN